ncbi:hypothetical protein A5780_27420 [Nocardia sp. 852002-20019_SCH5090214]|jgi:uncharacterized protein (DUF427 family)|uniref:Nucleotidyltransferase domain-containing protein n=1 Tax=Nocardia nova TaxID=37330 RepID=A0A2S6AC08_9NOCA|nr:MULTISPECIES: DUF427 domain-containing protein [Nocardia]OBF71260.1 hypothetical protein A9X06_30040 [Mycobacterium sp. 852002-51759_SCH5129042]MBF6273898.1 DUF427 domain-containing protein [Nocardia nova]MBV7706019.1 DUF427 domain-containing protein [Nocardia nova]OBA43439.1 hypothetical protein A5789_11000 [Nocardia sp. 852002-51101_SCH5132738]OBA52879.1 hypothetical protein A5780_27420 [Nocardia sp. 852002-20019_SCH5090214]
MQASGFAEWPDYRIDVRRIRNLVRVSHDDRHLAETTASLLVAEQDHGIVFYIPVADVRFDLLTLDEQLTSRCPFKGRARYWRPHDSAEPIAWEYTDPYPEVALIRDHIGFYQDRVRLEVGVATPAVSGVRQRAEAGSTPRAAE